MARIRVYPTNDTVGYTSIRVTYLERFTDRVVLMVITVMFRFRARKVPQHLVLGTTGSKDQTAGSVTGTSVTHVIELYTVAVFVTRPTGQINGVTHVANMTPYRPRNRVG